MFIESSLATSLRVSLTADADVILGTHKEGGATTFWSYTVNLPLSSNSMVSWKFCYLLHKVLRGGHRNVRTPVGNPTQPARPVASSLTASTPNVPCVHLTCRLFEIPAATAAASKIWALCG